MPEQKSLSPSPSTTIITFYIHGNDEVNDSLENKMRAEWVRGKSLEGDYMLAGLSYDYVTNPSGRT